ncbi:ESX secretion-associated protein EspG [Amycolatopsis sp. H20-H5]|uniref:ESX secretion-associated protein EspG n=1 Tax=Amycolatopsis sp. H20-H5 TaxID=3046309 RepID=UPI002DBCC255|nr:ESX secretion-associated protein EspG [Amycolatopsis sp. H20-H5]MEC3974297.1 ESX secretion-associated protein EspG [Amycolatopsis sp. H20-H5]
MSVIDRPVVLPKLAFLTVWDMVGLGEPHPIFGTNTHYVTGDGFARDLHARTMALLTEHGLARRDRLNPLWKATLRVIGLAGREFYAWSHHSGDGTHGAILVASHDGHAVRVAADDHVVSVEPVADKWHATHLLDALPDVPGARIKTVRVAEDFYDDPYAVSRSPLAEPVDTNDIDYLNKVMAVPRDAVHQFYTATRDDGDRVRSSPITALDLTGQGRVLTYRTDDDRIVAESGTPRQCISILNTTHAGL